MHDLTLISFCRRTELACSGRPFAASRPALVITIGRCPFCPSNKRECRLFHIPTECAVAAANHIGGKISLLLFDVPSPIGGGDYRGNICSFLPSAWYSVLMHANWGHAATPRLTLEHLLSHAATLGIRRPPCLYANDALIVPSPKNKAVLWKTTTNHNPFFGQQASLVAQEHFLF